MITVRFKKRTRLIEHLNECATWLAMNDVLTPTERRKVHERLMKRKRAADKLRETGKGK